MLRQLMKDAIINSGEKYDAYTDWLLKKLGRVIPLSQYVNPPTNRVEVSES